MALFDDMAERLRRMAGDLRDELRDEPASEPELAPTPEPAPDFDTVRDRIEFSGFTEEQQESILADFERIYEGSETGRALIDEGLAGEGLHVLNTNSQAVLEEFAAATQEDPRFQNSSVGELHGGNFAVTASAHPRTLSGGRIHVNAYDAIDPDTGEPEVYTNPELIGRSPLAADADPIYSLDQDGTVFEVDPFYILTHELGHAAGDDRDIVGNDPRAGEYYTPALLDGTPEGTIRAYRGLNEANTQIIMEELGVEQLRGSYLGTSLTGREPGEEFGLGRDHDVSVTSNRVFDATGHAPVDVVVTDSITQEVLDKFGVPDRTSLRDQVFRMGAGDDTVHAFDGDDGILPGAGDDRVYMGEGNDLVLGGRGNDVYDGGDANLDPESDHSSDASRDWGFDAVDYSRLDAGFAPPQLADGTVVEGVVISVSADEITVDKGQAAAPMPGSEVDRLNNIDAVVGTGRDDHVEVSAIADGSVFVGGGGNDTLRIDTMPEGEVVNLPGAGEFNGVPYDGRIVHDGKTLHYSGFETIELPGLEPTIEPPDRQNTPRLDPLPDAEVTPVDATDTSSSPTPFEDAVRILRDESDRALEEVPPELDSLLEPALASSYGQATIRTLAENGAPDLDLDPVAMEGDEASRVTEVLRATTAKLDEMGKLPEAEAAFNEMEAERLLESERALASTRANEDEHLYDPAYQREEAGVDYAL